MRIVSLGEVLRAFFFFQARLISSTRNFVRFRIEIYISGREGKVGRVANPLRIFPSSFNSARICSLQKKREREIQIISSLIHHFPR